jgi:hypothetical protein
MVPEAGPAGPNDAELAAKGEALLNPSAEPPADADAAAPLLAGKYSSLKDLEKAYLELQSKLGAAAGPAEAEQVKAVVGEEDFNRIRDEYAAGGSLSEETFKSLEARGISKPVVEAFIAGQQAIADRQAQEVYSSVGGEQAYADLIQWGASSLSKDEIEQFNADVQSGDIRRAKFAVRALSDRRAVSDRQPARLEGRATASAGEVFTSMAQVVDAMSDPRYARDAAYRRGVEERLARSGDLR